jgi:hypothetical protein
MVSALVRGALVVLALAAGAWLALGYRALELEADATAIVERGREAKLTPDEVRRGRDLLRDARRLNADKTPALDEGLLLSAAGRPEQGVRLVQDVLADEPDNFQGWFFVYVVSSDQALAREAFRRMRALDPLGAEALSKTRRRNS